MSSLDHNSETVGQLRRAEIIAFQAGLWVLALLFVAVGIALSITMWLIPIGLPLALWGIALLANAVEKHGRI